MRSKIEMRYKIHRMIDVLYSLELIDWDTYWHVAHYTAWVAYYKKLKE